MKIFTVLILFCVSVFQVNAQIINGGFESWSGAGMPTGWYLNNFPGLAVPLTQTNDAHSGSYAVRGEVVSFSTSFLPPLLQAGTAGEGFTITERYLTFKGYFKFAPVGGDELGIAVLLYNGVEPVGGGGIELTNAMGTYTEINVPLSYANESVVPDRMLVNVIIFGAQDQDPHIGSVFFADDFSMSTVVTGVKDDKQKLSFGLEQNYPNPFNPSTQIRYSIPVESKVVFTVYNALGNEVKKDTFFKGAGEYTLRFNANGLPSGVYFYNITAGQYSATKKFIIMK